LSILLDKLWRDVVVSQALPDRAPRFAIYAAPGTGSADSTAASLRERAEQWLGRAAAPGPVTAAAPAGWARADIDAMTVSARRYGFHATLKPPFRLADGRTPEELDAAIARFAAGSAAAVIPRLSLASMGGFFALVPGAEAPGLHALADEVVKGFDDFRAPPTGAELDRRNPAALTGRQRDLLERWGYPYVLDEFRFHLTLTDRIPRGQRPRVRRVLGDWFAPLLGASVPVDALALFTEAGPGAPFTLRAVHRLRQAPARRQAAGLADSQGAR
jgi:putative phosphonate metabolism protein